MPNYYVSMKSKWWPCEVLIDTTLFLLFIDLFLFLFLFLFMERKYFPNINNVLTLYLNYKGKDTARAHCRSSRATFRVCYVRAVMSGRGASHNATQAPLHSHFAVRTKSLSSRFSCPPRLLASSPPRACL